MQPRLPPQGQQTQPATPYSGSGNIPPALPPRPEEEDDDDKPYVPPPLAPRRNTNVLSLSGKKLSEEEQKKKAETERKMKEERLKQEKEKEARDASGKQSKRHCFRGRDGGQILKPQQPSLRRKKRRTTNHYLHHRIFLHLPCRGTTHPLRFLRETPKRSKKSSFMVNLKLQREKMRAQAEDRQKKEAEEGRLALPQVTTIEEANSLAGLIKQAMQDRAPFLQASDSEEDAGEWDWMACPRGDTISEVSFRRSVEALLSSLLDEAVRREREPRPDNFTY